MENCKDFLDIKACSGRESGLVKEENRSLQLIPAKKTLFCEDPDSSFFFSQTPVINFQTPIFVGLWSKRYKGLVNVKLILNQMG